MQLLRSCTDCGTRYPDADSACPACGHCNESRQLAALRSYVTDNWSSHYAGPFERLLGEELRGQKAGWTWNWSAAFTPLWFLYRRLYWAFIGFTTLHLVTLGMLTPVLFVVQGYWGDRLLFRKARAVLRVAGPHPDFARLIWLGRPLAWVPFLPFAPLVVAIFALVTPDGRGSAAGLRAGDEPGNPRNEQPATETKVVFSADGLSQVTVPGSWRPMPEMSEEEGIEAGSVAADQYVASVAESRIDLDSALDLAAYARWALDEARNRVTADSTSEARPLTVQGRSAIQYEIRGTTDRHIRVVYWVTVIETPHHFHRVFTWTLLSRASESEALLQDVVGSFRETTREAPAPVPSTDLSGPVTRG